MTSDTFPKGHLWVVLEGLKTRNVSFDLEPPMSPVTPDLCDPLTPGPGMRRLVKISSIGTESSDDFEERDPGEAGSRLGRWGNGGQAPLTLFFCRPGRWAREWVRQPVQEVDAVQRGPDPPAAAAEGPSQVPGVRGLHGQRDRV